MSFDSQNEALDELLKNKKFYVLFKVSEAGNSDDINYELDYMFRGIYTSYEAAYKYAIDEILEQADENDDNSKLEQIYDNISNIDREELDEILEDVEWKIIESGLN